MILMFQININEKLEELNYNTEENESEFEIEEEETDISDSTIDNDNELDNLNRRLNENDDNNYNIEEYTEPKSEDESFNIDFREVNNYTQNDINENSILNFINLTQYSIQTLENDDMTLKGVN